MYISEESKAKIKNLAGKYSLKLVVLYGSHAKNTNKANSDIDIAILGNEEITFDDIVELNNDFSDIFQVKEIDVKSLHNVGPFFRYEVMNKSVLLFGNDYNYSSFRAYAFRDYCDSRSLLDLKLIMINKRIADLKTI